MASVKRKARSLREARTLEDLCKLKRDNHSYGDYWLIADRGVTIAKQKNGHPAEVVLKIPKRAFNFLIDFYNREQS